MNIKNIIFDLGGVILDIDPEKAKKNFLKMGLENPEEDFERIKSSEVFLKHEKGDISTSRFYEIISSFYKRKPSEQMIKQAWNSMIIDIPTKRLEFVNSLKENFKIFLLSNTNDIHIEKFESMVFNKTRKKLSDYFHSVYYSCEIQTRKPEPDSWLTIVNEKKIEPYETLFIDDWEANVVAARKLGFQTIHFNPTNCVIMELSNYLKNGKN